MATKRPEFIDRRDFRAVIFTSQKLRSLSDVVCLFDGESSEDGAIIAGKVQSIRVKYYSTSCFLRTSDPEKRNSMRRYPNDPNDGLFEYDVYVLSRVKAHETIFMVAVPFAGMARELFGKIHDRKPDSTFTYLRPELDALVENLREKTQGAENIRAVGINWSVAGDTGRSDQITIRGSDVVESRVYEHIQHRSPGINLSLRKVQVVYEAKFRRELLKISFDKFGNYGVWVSGEGSNLPAVFEIIELFNKFKLIQKERDFPVRNREDEPMLT